MARRLLRFASNVIAALSLLGLAAVVVLWVRSYSHVDYPKVRSDRYGVAAYSTSGGVRFSFAKYPQPRGASGRSEWEVERGRADYPGSHAGRIVLGFGADRGGQPGGYWYGVTVPYWFLAAATAALPGAALLRWRRSRARVRPGVCARCGYDLRATPERCPECGTASAGAPPLP